MTCQWESTCSYKVINDLFYCLRERVLISPLSECCLFVIRRRTGVRDLPGSPGTRQAAPLHEGHGNGRAGSGAALPEGRLQKHVWKAAVPTRKPAFDPDCCHLVDSCRTAPICLQEVVAHWIAECRLMIEQTRLLTLHAAHALDTMGSRAARKQVKHSHQKSHFNWTVCHFLHFLPFLDCHDQGGRCQDGLQSHRLCYPGVWWCGGVWRCPAGTDVSTSPQPLESSMYSS